MSNTYEFLKVILDTVAEHIVVIDRDGVIVFVNRTWCLFGENNQSDIKDCAWEGHNYLDECDKAAAMGDDYGLNAAKGIRSIISGDKENFEFEYPCHSPTEKRWFLMQTIPFSIDGCDYYVISHLNITKRKLAEEEVWNLSRLDGLTGIANRRCFDDFIVSELSRCGRLGVPITLALIDLDDFKLINDTYGHLVGDDYLKEVGNVLKSYMQRPGDLSARYGGEEFAIVFGNTDLDQALPLMNRVIGEIRALKLPNEHGRAAPILTVSIGIATIWPDKSSHVSELIENADNLLFTAKNRGRNQIATHLIE